MYSNLVSHLHKTISKIHAISKIIRPGQVPIEGEGVELCQDEYFPNATVDAITHGNIYEPVTPSNRNLQNLIKKKQNFTQKDSPFQPLAINIQHSKLKRKIIFIQQAHRY